MNVVERAKWFAIGAHEAVGDKRRYTGEPVSVHLESVARQLEELGYDEETVAAGWLHDVVEDTDVTLDVLRSLFPEKTCLIVEYSTQIALKGDGTRRERSKANHEHYAQGLEESQTLKLADSNCNTPSIVHHDPRFGKTYVKEKSHLHTLLTKAHPVMIERHERMLRACKAKLAKHFDTPSP